MYNIFLSNIKILLFYAAISVCIVLSIFIKPLVYCALLLLLLFFSTESIKNNICLIVAIIPFANVFKLSPSSTSFLSIVEIALITLCLIKGNRISGYTIFGIILFTFFALLQISLGCSCSLSFFFKHIIRFLFLSFAIKYSDLECLIKACYLFSISLLLSGVLSRNEYYYSSALPYLVEITELISGETIFRQSALYRDPNYYGLSIIMLLSMLMVLYDFNKERLIFWFTAPFLLFLGITTYSKSFFLTSVFLVFYFVIFVLRRKNLFVFMLTSIIIIFVAFQAVNHQYDNINVIYERFFVHEITTGRIDINSYYIDHLLNNKSILLFGAGISASPLPIIERVPHNFIIDCFYRIGLIGLFIYISSIILCLSVESFGNLLLHKRKSQYLPLLCFFLQYSSLAGLNSFDFYYYIFFVFASLKLDPINSSDHLSSITINKSLTSYSS